MAFCRRFPLPAQNAIEGNAGELLARVQEAVGDAVLLFNMLGITDEVPLWVDVSTAYICMLLGG